MKNNLLLSLIVLVVIAGGLIGATSAFYADLETSDNNDFIMGSLNLQVDGKDDPDVYHFELSGLKPNDKGEHTFKLTNTGSIPGYASLTLNNFTDSDNGIEEPEAEAGDTTDGVNQGELDEQTIITVWLDTDCDNEQDQGEDVILEDYASNLPWNIDLLDSDNGYVSNDILLSSGGLACVAVQYEFECKGETTESNLAQSDSFAFDIIFDLEQTTDQVAKFCNGGFEFEDFTNWSLLTPVGSEVEIATSYNGDQGTTYTAVAGLYFARLKTDGPGSLTKATREVELLSGMKLTGWAAFDARDYLPFNDYAQVRVLDGIGNELAKPWYADISLIGNYADGPWTQWEWIAPADGTYTLELSITNMGDSIQDSQALFDANVIIQ
ncbi:MAG: TasA family protein [bacterium]